MNNFQKVSILIPVYNRSEIIMESLNSAVNQTYKNIEVIVVDNKSTDNTFEILKKFGKPYSNVRVYQNEENIGPVRNWKKCLDYATSEYIKILYSDDLIAFDFIEKTMPYLVVDDDVGFVFTGTEIFNDETGKISRAYIIGDTGLYDTKTFIEGCLLGGSFPVSPGNALFRKKDIENNLILDVPNKIGSDFRTHAIGNDLLIYLLTAKDYPRFAFVNETLSFFRVHANSITISSNAAELATLYNVAKAYFVENYVINEGLRKKFNTRVLVNLLLRGGGNIRVRKIQDFYLTDDEFGIDYLFLGKLILRKIFSIFLGWFV